MNIFEKMIDDVFDIPEFIQYFCTPDNKDVVAISYEKATDTIYTEYGIDDGVSFYLTCKVKDYTPKKGDKITFRNQVYKVDTFSADSFNLTYKIFLKDLTSR